MTAKQSAALQRLVIISLAWAAGETILRLLGLGSLATFGGALVGVAAFFATQGGMPTRGRRGDVIYWRGRAIDRDDWRH